MPLMDKKDAKYLIKDDYINEFYRFWGDLEDKERYEIKKFHNRYEEKLGHPVKSDLQSDKKIMKLDKIADTFNRLSKVYFEDIKTSKQMNPQYHVTLEDLFKHLIKNKLKEYTMEAVELCKGEKKEEWIIYLSDF